MNILMNSWYLDKARLQAVAQQIDKSVHLYTKDNWFCTVLSWLLTIIAFGGIERRVFLTRFATTIGPLQFYPASWNIASVERVIVHESRHTRQARWFGLGIHPWLGLPLFAVFYLLLFLPMGLAFFRCWFEMDAMRFELRGGYARGYYKASEVTLRAEGFGRTVCSKAYGWPLPQSWGLPMFKRAAEQILKEEHA